jgi:UDP-N-acetylglucosamine 2-epimerase
MRVTVVTGTRPQIIKTAPLLNVLAKENLEIDFVHTGQHYDFEMATQFIEDLSISKPNHNLGIGSGTNAYQIYEIMMRLSAYIEKNPPEYIITPGDTNPALGAALVGFKMDIPTCHLESGLRSYDMRMQEEVNRRLIDHGAAGLFAPTAVAVENLKNENVQGQVFLTGDTMYDILKDRMSKFLEKSQIEAALTKVGLSQIEYAVLTLHRRETVDNPSKLKSVVHSLSKIGRDIVFPIHPRTEERIKENSLVLPSNVVKTKPLPYDTMLALVSRASLLMTDSGGLQKEAYLLNTPCVTIRDNTEWVETLTAGANVLTSSNWQDINEAVSSMWGKKLDNDASVYGDGKASEKIASILGSGEIATR